MEEGGREGGGRVGGRREEGGEKEGERKGGGNIKSVANQCSSLLPMTSSLNSLLSLATQYPVDLLQ